MLDEVEQALNIFKQKYCQDNKQQVFYTFEDEHTISPTVQYILSLLSDASSDINIRMTMNVEDEIKMTLNSRDARIREQDRIISQQAKQIRLNAELIRLNAEMIRLNAEMIRLNDKLIRNMRLISKKNGQITEAIRMLLGVGTPIEVICKNLRVTEEFVNSLREVYL